MTLYLRLYWEFFKTGLFAIGGGMATLPFLKDIGATTGWFSQTDLMNMLAVSESTPGPVGINMATYVGYTVGGVPGASTMKRPLMPRCITSASPSSRSAIRYFARRDRASIRRPVRRSAKRSGRGKRRSGRRCSMRAKRSPSMAGSSPRRTVSTSGSSGMSATSNKACVERARDKPAAFGY